MQSQLGKRSIEFHLALRKRSRPRDRFFSFGGVPKGPTGRSNDGDRHGSRYCTANLRTKILDFRGLDSSTILIPKGGILMSMGNFLDNLSQHILVEIILSRGILVETEASAWASRADDARAGRSGQKWRGGFRLRHQLNGYLDQRVPSLFLASSFSNCSNRAVLKCMFP